MYTQKQQHFCGEIIPTKSEKKKEDDDDAKRRKKSIFKVDYVFIPLLTFI